MRTNWVPYAMIAIFIIFVGLMALYIVGALHTHSSQIDCLTRVVNQALNEAFHKQHISPPVCKN